MLVFALFCGKEQAGVGQQVVNVYNLGKRFSCKLTTIILANT